MGKKKSSVRSTTAQAVRGAVAVFILALVFNSVRVVSASAAEPKLLDIKPFQVLMTYENEEEGKVFNSRNPLYLDISFTLAMSEGKRYPVSITLIQEAGGNVEEEVLYKGSLSEGYYKLRSPVNRFPTSRGEVQVRVIVKARVFSNRSSYYSYQRWEGTYKVGSR